MRDSYVKRRRLIHQCALVLILIAAFLVRARGVNWPRYHPDEYPIARWIEAGEPDRVYPGGTFQLAKPFRFIWRQGLVLKKTLFLTPHEPSIDYILLGRIMNVFLGATTCLLVYGISVNTTGSRSAGCLGALFLAFAPYHVEHAHHAQSDVPMLFMFAVSVWTWTRLIRTDNAVWFFLAGAACGATAGTKFTLMILLAPWMVFAVGHGFKKDRYKGGLLWGGAGFAAFVAGLLLASPAILDLSPFLEGLRYEQVRVNNEGLAGMGALAGNERVRMASHLNHFIRGWRAMGLGWWILSGAGLISLCCHSRFRKFWLPLVFVPGVYTLYWFFLAPWVRNQEFLLFLVPAAVLAGLPLAWIVDRAEWRCARPAVLGIYVVALIPTFIHGMRVSSIYGWLDTRDQATRWLQRHEPDGMLTATERYASVTPRGERSDVPMAARMGIEALRAGEYDFLMLQGTKGRRGMLHPVTQELYPPYAENYLKVLEGSESLRHWAPLPPELTHTTFNSLRLEYRALSRGLASVTVSAFLPQPGYESRRAYETFYRKGSHLGARTTLRVNRDPLTFAVSGLESLDTAIYAVVSTRERDADIELKGFGRTHSLALGPYDAKVVPLKRPFWRPRLSHVEPVTVRAIPRPHIKYIPAYITLAFDEAEARRVLADLGHIHPQPDAKRLENLEDAVNHPPEEIQYLDVSGRQYNHFARWRPLNTDPETLDPSRRLSLVQSTEGASAPWIFQSDFNAGYNTFHRISAPFTLRMHLDASHRDTPNSESRFGIRIIEESSGKILKELFRTWPHPDGYEDISIDVAAGREGPFRVRLESTEPAVVTITDLQYEWGLEEVLGRALLENQLVLARHRLHTGNEEGVAGLLPKVDPAPQDPLYFMARRLRFLAADPHEKSVLAAELLAEAPGYYPALQWLAETETPSLNNRMRALTPSHSHPISFSPFVRCHGVGIDETNGRVGLVLEALVDRPPSLNLTWNEKRRREWRVRDRLPIFPSRPVAAGERFQVYLPKDVDVLSPRVRSHWGIGVESDVKWHAGKLRVDGGDLQVVPLETWLK